jgi:hypothetical protein
MTSMIAESVILKTDRRGRVRTPLARREALLDAFECSGLSGIKFAVMHGVKYPSLANRVQQRKRRRSMSATSAGPECGADKVTGAGGSSLRWWEGVVDNGAARCDSAGNAGPCGLQAYLPCGVRMGERYAMGPEGNLLARMDRNPSAATATLPKMTIGSEPVADTFHRADQVSCA